MAKEPRDLEAVFYAAQHKEAEERAAYLDEVCADDPALRQRVEQFLSAQAEIGSFLEPAVPALAATVDEPPIREGPGTVIGPYKLLEQIGEGGFGAVFMAEQQQPIRRKVALKVIKPGMDSRQVIARFEAERQALALMDHPNIAHVFDGGETSSGRPYFVMELVKGMPITEYCDQDRLIVRERLELFITVCHAVQHAHQKGIIHRDLKPSNVMVTLHDGTPLVKIIDFGIAKATGQHLTEKTLFTNFAHLIGTPMYMSPEQAALSGLDVDTRSDVYSLGVLLYELLTGTTPFEKQRFKEAGYDEMRRIIREEEPAKPSTRISTLGLAATTVSVNRRSDPRRLSQLFHGELDWIVMKALEKDRNRRYETASALARDIERYLHDEAVQACPPSRWYRFRKFARRNKVALGGALAAALAMLGLVAGVVWHNAQLGVKVREIEEQKRKSEREAERAEANFAKTLEAVDKFLSRVGQQRLANVPGMERVRREILEEALVFFEGFLQAKGAEPGVRRETGQAYYRVGRIAYLLGQHERAEQAFRKALEVQGQLRDEIPERPESRHDLSCSYVRLAHVLASTGRPSEAEQASRQSLDLVAQVAAEFPDRSKFRHDLALGHVNLANMVRNAGRLPEAESHYVEARDVLEQLAAEFPTVPDYRNALAGCHNNLATLLSQTGRLPEAENACLRSRDLWKQLAAEFPNNPEYRYDLAMILANLSNVWADKGRFPEAEQALREGRDLFAKLAADFPAVPDYRRDLARSHDNLGMLLAETGRRVEAEQAHRAALELWEPLVAGFQKVPVYRHQLGATLAALAQLLRQRGELTESRRLLEKAISHQQAAVQANRQHPGYRQSLGDHYSDMAETLIAMGLHGEAAKAAEEAPRLDPSRWQVYEGAGRLLARCVPLAEKDDQLAAGERRALGQQYAGRAVELLGEAVAKGYQKAEALRKDSVFEPLRGRADFQALLRTLEARAKPD
jgi:serine/threonine protein kinase/tetratricopeptide (TPR) repeat protein